ncbi:MAG: threonylcarbamoyl-AMP synthase [Bacteroidetes bacterium]|mgnify:CR=1 FL=1|nr:MAG: threonylcarbamoyl-AMP synthase [Bacteroidota bacterium]REK08182.1 MAG: threonylcarbamoyl-AMP synthase [Bacteroidota bacterium]REK32387.1 MAG: threonylcarbamoyl-AMP synthase [Bacteroidota bacterium]REK47439.1 MAG: threonylcarbamoyl-AMP synthase [Bacteroidota bacterium]
MEYKVELENALKTLQEGGLILYPTDTVWGIGCDACNPEAVAKIYELKRREDSKSMIIMLDNAVKLQSYISEVPEQAFTLIEHAERPLTIIYDGARNLAGNLIASDGSVGIRVTKDKFCSDLISRFKKPIVSTSANISGEPTPQNYNDISELIRNGVDYIVNLRKDESENPRPSTIIRLRKNGEIEFIRK